MSTKLKGDIAEQSAIIQALKRNFGVSKPIGDRLPYDLIFDIENKLFRIQVKSAWFEKKSKNFLVDNRRSKTNRREIKRDTYETDDFDFALIYIDILDIFYIFPIEVFLSYKGIISLVENEKRQRRPKSFKYRSAWKLLKRGNL